MIERVEEHTYIRNGEIYIVSYSIYYTNPVIKGMHGTKSGFTPASAIATLTEEERNAIKLRAYHFL